MPHTTRRANYRAKRRETIERETKESAGLGA